MSTATQRVAANNPTTRSGSERGHEVRLKAKAIESNGATSGPEISSLALFYEAAKIPYEEFHRAYCELSDEEMKRADEAAPGLRRDFIDASMSLASAIRARGGLATMTNGKMYILTQAFDDDDPPFVEFIAVLDTDAIKAASDGDAKDFEDPDFDLASAIRAMGGSAADAGDTLYILMNAFDEDSFRVADRVMRMPLACLI